MRVRGACLQRGPSTPRSTTEEWNYSLTSIISSLRFTVHTITLFPASLHSLLNFSPPRVTRHEKDMLKLSQASQKYSRAMRGDIPMWERRMDGGRWRLAGAMNFGCQRPRTIRGAMVRFQLGWEVMVSLCGARRGER